MHGADSAKSGPYIFATILLDVFTDVDCLDVENGSLIGYQKRWEALGEHGIVKGPEFGWAWFL